MEEDDKSGVDFSMILASSAHDMKNSVGMLMNTLDQLIQELPPTTKAHSTLYSSVQYESSRINSELMQLLTLYRVKNTTVPIHVDQHFIIDIVEEQVARNQTLLDINNISISTRCDPAISSYIDGDLIGSVIHNILLNSIRYTHTCVAISVSLKSGFLVISIEDDGKGYPEAMLKHAFNKKAHVSSSLNSTQLGLYFAYCIAREHSSEMQKGHIKLSNNRLLSGGCFELFLPNDS